MAVLADSNAGFKGMLDTAQWARIAGMGTRYAIQGADHLVVSRGTGTRVVRVGAGAAWGDGVLSTFFSPTDLTGAEVSSGSRWDTVVVRRTWQPALNPTGKAELVLLPGSATKGISVQRQTGAGTTVSDQPIALVRFQAGQTAAQEFVDLRVWAGMGGTPVAATTDALAYLADVGTVVLVGDTRYVRQQVASGALEWVSATQMVRRLRLVDAPTIQPNVTTPITGTFGLLSGDPGNIPGGIQYGSGVLTVPSAGVYSTAAQFLFDTSNDTSYRELHLYVNGQSAERAATRENTTLSLSTHLYLNSGDTLQLYVRQATGAPLRLHPTAEYKTWSVAKVG